MPWVITASFDKTRALDQGSCTATWTDPLPALGVFSYSAQVKPTVAAGNEFVADAIKARNIWQTVTQGNINKAALLLTRINATDPKAV